MPKTIDAPKPIKNDLYPKNNPIDIENNSEIIIPFIDAFAGYPNAFEAIDVTVLGMYTCFK